MSALTFNSWQHTDGTEFKECLQIVYASWDNNPDLYYWLQNGGSSGYFETGLQVSITAKKANSKFFATLDGEGYWDTAAPGGVNFSIYRDSTQVVGSASDQWTAIGNAWSATSASFSRLRTAWDEPNVAAGTTLTYKAYLGRWTGSGRVGFGWPGYISQNKIIVMEFEA